MRAFFFFSLWWFVFGCCAVAPAQHQPANATPEAAEGPLLLSTDEPARTAPPTAAQVNQVRTVTSPSTEDQENLVRLRNAMMEAEASESEAFTDSHNL